MKATIQHNNIFYDVNLDHPIDISVPINSEGVSAWGASPLEITPVKNGDWIGDVERGAAVNFNNITFNPHAHTTHTECVGHISPKKESLSKELKTFFFISNLITLVPKKKGNDCVVTKNMIESIFSNHENFDALIIRTLPNNKTKINKNYSNTNHPYLLKEAVDYIVDVGIKHVLIDLPSIDKENDEGKLIAHKSFWRFPKNIRHGSTITEFIYVPNRIADGKYLLNLQFPPFENDASPSRPLLFKLNSKT